MHLVEVDPLDPEPLQRCLDLAPDARRGADLARRRLAVILVPDQPAFGEDVGALAAGGFGERPADDLLGMTETVDRRCVDPVDPALERVADRPDGVAVVLGAPADGPGTADRPGAEADARDRHAGAAERTGGKGSRSRNRTVEPGVGRLKVGDLR